MSSLLLAAATGLACRALWPVVWRPPLIPAHVLVGSGRVADALPRVLIGVTTALKWAAPLAIATMSGTMAALGVAVLLVVAGALGFMSRPPRPHAAPLVHDALWVGAAALIVAASAGPWPLLAGLGVGAVVAVGVIGVHWLAWGVRPRFSQTVRPWFRVHGDNPDVSGATARIRVPGDVIVEVTDSGAPFTSLIVNSVGHARVAAIDSSVLRPLLNANGRATVRIGVSPDPVGVDAVVAVPAGRHLVTIRDYEADRTRWPLPQVRREP